MFMYKTPNNEATINPREASVKPKLPFAVNAFSPSTKMLEKLITFYS